MPRPSYEDKDSQLGVVGNIFRKLYNKAWGFLPGSSLTCDIYSTVSPISSSAGKNKATFKANILNEIPEWPTKLCSHAQTASNSIHAPDGVTERAMPESVDEANPSELLGKKWIKY